jgi:hypothetical protein
MYTAKPLHKNLIIFKFMQFNYILILEIPFNLPNAVIRKAMYIKHLYVWEMLRVALKKCVFNHMYIGLPHIFCIDTCNWPNCLDWLGFNVICSEVSRSLCHGHDDAQASAWQETWRHTYAVWMLNHDHEPLGRGFDSQRRLNYSFCCSCLRLWSSHLSVSRSTIITYVW